MTISRIDKLITSLYVAIATLLLALSTVLSVTDYTYSASVAFTISCISLYLALKNYKYSKKKCELNLQSINVELNNGPRPFTEKEPVELKIIYNNVKDVP